LGYKQIRCTESEADALNEEERQRQMKENKEIKIKKSKHGFHYACSFI
jgi:hypothetical protein